MPHVRSLASAQTTAMQGRYTCCHPPIKAVLELTTMTYEHHKRVSLQSIKSDIDAFLAVDGVLMGGFLRFCVHFGDSFTSARIIEVNLHKRQ